jgi:RNA polymerase sigma factor (sigma-70 family)
MVPVASTNAVNELVDRPRTDAMGTELSDRQLAIIFERYGFLILRWAERIFRDGATADDVLHEVMLRLLRKGRTFAELESEGQRRQWLYRTTLRLCWDIKARIRRERGRAETAAAYTPDVCNMPLEARDALDVLLQRLTVEERIIAVLFYEEGYTKLEIHELVARSRPFVDKKLTEIATALQRIQEPSA